MVEKSNATCPQCGADLEPAANKKVGVCPRCRQPSDISKLTTENTLSQTDLSYGNDTLFGTKTDGWPHQTNHSAARPADLFGEYELLGEIARGGMGVVFKARQIKANRIVALKMILNRRLGGSGAVERFKLEAEAAARLDHPNIVPIYDVGEINNQHYFTMGFVDGDSLKSLIENGPLDGRDAADTIRELALAVEYAHSQGVIHRDIKPSNILMRSAKNDESRGSTSRNNSGSSTAPTRGRPMITDFGLAKQIDSDSELTTSGQVMGTPQFMAPEQARGDIANVGPAADIYSLGATLYQLLTGRPPHLASNVVDTLQQVLNEEPIPPSRFNNHIDRDLETICLKCLQKDPRRRYATAQGLADELQRFINDEPILARPVGQVERTWRWCKRNPTMALLISAVVAAMLIGMSVSTYFAWVANERANTAMFQTKRANSNAEDFRRQRDRAEEEKKRADEKTIEVRNERDEVARQKEKLRWQLYLNYIASAHHQWQYGQIDAALTDLADCPEDLRGWEYEYLNTLFHRGYRSLQEHGQSSHHCLAYNSDGSVLATGKYTGEVKLWDVASGREIASLPGHSEHINSIAFSKDDRLIFTGSWDGTLKMWDATFHQCLKTIPTRKKSDTGMALSPDEKFLATGGMDGVARIYDIKTGELTSELKGHSVVIMAIAYSPDGKTIATGSQDFTVKLWNAETGQCTHTLQHYHRLGSLAFHPDGTRLASGCWDGSVSVWNTASGEKVHEINNAHGDRVGSIAYSSDGSRMVTGSEDRLIKIWDADRKQPTHTLKGHAGEVMSVAFHPDGNQIASSGLPPREGPGLRLWDITQNFDLVTTHAHIGGGANCFDYSRGGSRLVTAGSDYMLNVWDGKTGLLQFQLEPRENIASVAFSPDGKRFVTGGDKNDIRVWDAATGDIKLTLKGHTEPVECVFFSPDGKRIFSSGQDNAIRAWDAKTGDSIYVIQGEYGRYFQQVACSPNGKLLVSASTDFTLTVWNAETGKSMRALVGHHSPVWSVAFSHDGKRIVSGSGVGEIIVWETETGDKQFAVSRSTDSISSLAFSPDDERIVSTSKGQTILWDAATGDSTLTIQDVGTFVSQAAFSPDGRRLVTSNGRGKIHFYEANRRHELQSERNAIFEKSTRIAELIAANKITSTPRVGGAGGDAFEWITDNGEFLVGMKCQLGFYEQQLVVTGIELVMKNANGDESSRFVGKNGLLVVSAYAPIGHFVNGVSITSGDFIHGLQLHYQSLDGEKSPTSSKWLGTDFTPPKRFDFKNNAVVGLRGAHGDVIDSLEIISTTD